MVIHIDLIQKVDIEEVVTMGAVDKVVADINDK
jgi:hypothetical protein